jgi:hypothetical protein
LRQHAPRERLISRTRGFSLLTFTSVWHIIHRYV